MLCGRVAGVAAARGVSYGATPAGTAARSLATVEDLYKTALYDLHVDLGGKMVPFAGYSLPVQYPDGVLTSHMHTRSDDCASLFDVGHMGQITWTGKDAAAFLERLCVSDIAGMKEGEAKLSVLTTEKGGIMDDTVISRVGDAFKMVVNGATKFGDMEHFREQLEAFRANGGDVNMEYHHTQNLVALQGPGAQRVLQALLPLSVDLSAVSFMTAFHTTVAGAECLVTRCGYTGEDGFEVSISPDNAVAVASAMLEADRVLPAGLGARDSLRLEAGLCLYGNDLDTTTTPVEAGLAWTIGKPRRTGDRANFIGADVILPQLRDKSWPRRRVGLGITGAPARAGAKILSADGEEIGTVTSGTMSPCLKRPIAMGYVAKGHHKSGTAVKVEVRKKQFDAVIEKMPFVPANYYFPA